MDRLLALARREHAEVAITPWAELHAVVRALPSEPHEIARRSATVQLCSSAQSCIRILKCGQFPNSKLRVDYLKNMLGLVKPGGNLALIDFVTREGRESNWDQKLYKWWFSMDGVYFNREHVDWLRAQKSLSTIWYSEEESRVPYTPYTPTHYLYVGEKAK